MQLKRRQEGFTLLETVIYVALLAIMVGGGMVGIYNIIESSNRTRHSMFREQEAYFIMRKIDTVLAESTSVTTPAPDSSSDTLVVQTPSGEVEINFDDEQIFVRRGGGDSVFLNDTLVTASDLQFTGSSAPRTITTTFKLDEHEYAINNFLLHD